MKEKGLILAAGFSYFFVSFFVWMLVGALGVYMAQDFGLSAAQTGLMVAVPLLLGAGVRIPLGLLVDRIGPRRTGLGCLFLTLVPLLGLWLASWSFKSLLFFGFLLGIAGGSFAVAIPLVSSAFEERWKGTVLGMLGIGNGGAFFAAFLGPHLAEAYGWRSVFGIALIPLLMVLLLYFFLVREAPSPSRSLQNAFEGFSLLKDRDLYHFGLFYMVFFGGLIGLGSYLPVFFHEHYDLSKTAAGHWTAVCVLLGTFARPLGGYLADRWNGITLVAFLLVFLSLFVLGLGFLLPWPLELVFFMGAMTALGMGSGAVFQLVPLRFGGQIGAATGWVGAYGGLGGFFIPLMLGILKDALGTFSAGFILFASGILFTYRVLKRAEERWLKEPTGVALSTVPLRFLDRIRS